jgi:CrcB protein
MDAAQYVWVFVFGGLGSMARFGVASFAAARLGTGFPWGTLAVNVLGAALLAALLQVATAGDAISPTARIALATGFLGGFTTYSAFSNETFALLQRRHGARARLRRRHRRRLPRHVPRRTGRGARARRLSARVAPAPRGCAAAPPRWRARRAR